MLVNFDYWCYDCGVIEITYSTEEYPDRNFPKEIDHCESKAVMMLTTRSMQPDSYWSGKNINTLGIHVTSKDYLKRYCKTNNIRQITDEELKTTKHKSKKDIVVEAMNKPEVERERRRVISESLDGFGVIDSVNMEK
jgi:hypothetical protein